MVANVGSSGGVIVAVVVIFAVAIFICPTHSFKIGARIRLAVELKRFDTLRESHVLNSINDGIGHGDNSDARTGDLFARPKMQQLVPTG